MAFMSVQLLLLQLFLRETYFVEINAVGKTRALIKITYGYLINWWMEMDIVRYLDLSKKI